VAVGESLVDGLIASVLAAVSAVVGWLTSQVMKNKDASVLGTAERESIKGRVSALEGDMLTKEDVRSVVEDALTKRDDLNRDRREEWDKRLTLQIKAAVHDGIKGCPYMRKDH